MKSIGDENTLAPDGDSRNHGYTLNVGQDFGQYKIARPLGRGGMGEVYEVEHKVLRRRYALKLLPPDFASRPQALERFEREAQVMANLEHPNILKVDDSGETEGRYWLRMELATGVLKDGNRLISLRDYAAAKDGKIDQELLAGILRHVLNGLAYSHGHGAIHRDIKPGNILFVTDEDGETLVKVADFGLVKLVGEEWIRSQAEQSVKASMSLGDQGTAVPEEASTNTGSLLGTFEYMSPEQKRGDEADERSDVYAVGLMTYRLLTGHRELSFKLPSQIEPGLVPEWDDFVTQALEPNRDDRPRSCATLIQRLGKIEHWIAEREEQRREEQERQRQEALREEQRKQEEGERKTAEAKRREQLERQQQEALKQEEERQQGQRKREAEEKQVLARKQMVRSRKGHRWLWACSIFVLVAVAIVTFLMFHNRPRINPYPSVKQPGKPKEGQDWTAPGIDMEFVWLPAMKCWVAKYEATNGEYRKFKPDHDSKEYKGHTLNDNRQPVVLVTYDDAVAFAEWLTKREQEAGRLSAGVKYRLPDGDEWMTFAQCGDGRQSPWGNEWPPKYGNYYGKTGGKVLDLAKELKNETFIPISDYDDGFPVTCPVEESGKNAWGLYGVGGNAWEWTNELHADKSQRILCGSSWFNFHRSTLQCAYRNPHHPSFREVYNGFRLSLFRSPAAQEQASATVSESGSTTMTSNTSDAPKPSEPVKRKPAVAQPKPEPKPPESEKTTGGPIEGQDWAIPGVGMEFVWIEALKCWVGKCEVTNGEYRKFKPDHDSKDCEGHTLNDDRQPVVEVSYDDAVAFAEWVTDGERESGRLPDGFRYRLPDGNEWTTFAQCGDGREYPWGNEWPPKYGNYADETAKKKGKESDYCIDGYDDGFPITSSVEKSGKNDWGL